jgi:hypothetical protein
VIGNLAVVRCADKAGDARNCIVGSTLTRASRRLQKDTATAAPVALSRD